MSPSESRWLTWISTVATVIGTLLAFNQKPQFSFSPVLAIGAVFLLVGALLFWKATSAARSSESTLLALENTVTLENGGQKATITRFQKRRFNKPLPRARMLVATFSADGAIEKIVAKETGTDLLIYGTGTGNTDPYEIEPEGGKLLIFKNYRGAVGKNAVVEEKLEATINGGWDKATEYIATTINHPTKAFSGTINLHRSCLRASCATENPFKVMEDPKLSGDRKTITYEVKNPKLDARYRISWDW